MCCKDGPSLLICIVIYMEAESMLRSVTTFTTPNLRGPCALFVLELNLFCVLGFMEPIK